MGKTRLEGVEELCKYILFKNASTNLFMFSIKSHFPLNETHPHRILDRCKVSPSLQSHTKHTPTSGPPAKNKPVEEGILRSVQVLSGQALKQLDLLLPYLF